MKRIFAFLLVSVFLAMIALAAQGQDKLQASEFQVSFDSGGHSTPMISKDSIGDLIVYSQYPIVNGVPGNASIYYQRVGNGAPFGPPVTVADSPANQWLNDVSGDNIVYTLSPSIGAYGNIILYQISTAQARALTTAGNAWEPRIFGDYVVWIEMNASGGQAVMYQISSGAPVQTTVMAGPSPSVAEVSIGDRFVVWSQYVNGHFQIAAYDMLKGLSVSVASDAQADLRVPSTQGAWIAWESRKTSGANFDVDIKAINMDTATTRVVASNGSQNMRPHVSGDLISYESNVLGARQIFVYRIAEGDTFRVTSSTRDEFLNDLLGNLVTYIDSRNGNDGVFASSISFVPSSSQPITATPNPVNFGSVNVGTNSTQNVTLNINTGLTVSSITVAGDYSVGANSCVTTFSFASNCTVPVTFIPTKPGQRWFPLSVTDGDGNSYSFSLRGTGTGPALAFTPGMINTVVGAGTACADSTTACGDNGPSISAQLAGPTGLFMDSAGNFYFADNSDNRIRVANNQSTAIAVAGVTIAPGNIATVAGTGTQGYSNGTGQATTAELYYPNAAVIDTAGNLYIADTDNMLVRKVDATGNISTFAGAGAGIGGGCADAINNVGDGCPATSAYLSNTAGIAVDAAGNVYIADWGDSRIRRVGADGIITTVAGNGTLGFSGDGQAATNAELQYPSGMAFDSLGNLYIADTFNHRVRKVNTGGTITTVAGSGAIGVSAGGYSGDGGPATEAQLNQPEAVAVDSAGNLYIADTANYRIRKVDPSGTITTVAGFGPLGTACSFGTYIWGDGCQATSAFIGFPQGIAVDGAGNLYISDNQGNRIRKVDVSTSSMSFGSVQLGLSSDAQSLQLSNVGNANLTFAQTDAFSVSSNFGLQSGGTSECLAGSSLLPGASCTLQVLFAPTGQGSVSGTLNVSDNAINSPQTVSLSGTGINMPPAFGLPAPGSTLAVAEATGPSGAVVVFSNPSATTGSGAAATVACTPASGSQFALGQTPVSCTATDPSAPSLQTSATFYVGVHDTTPPVLTLPSNIVTDAIAPNGASVSYTVTATDLVDSRPSVSCSQASGTVFAIGTTTVTCTATDSSGNTSSGNFTVLVKAAAQQVTDLVTLVNATNVKQGIENSLDTKLQNAETALAAANAGIPANVCNMMAAFINETAAQSGKALTVDQANQLIANAARIKTVLGCQ